MSKLDPSKHYRLIQAGAKYCGIAGIHPADLEGSIIGVCNPTEILWAKGYRAKRTAGRNLLLTGAHTPAPQEKMVALTAMFLRNDVDARIRTTHELLDSMDAGTRPDPTVLLIPNLHSSQTGKSLPSWRVENLMDLLITRCNGHRLTVAHVESLQLIASDYGFAFHKLLNENYDKSAN